MTRPRPGVSAAAAAALVAAAVGFGGMAAYSRDTPRAEAAMVPVPDQLTAWMACRDVMQVQVTVAPYTADQLITDQPDELTDAARILYAAAVDLTGPLQSAVAAYAHDLAALRLALLAGDTPDVQRIRAHAREQAQAIADGCARIAL